VSFSFINSIIFSILLVLQCVSGLSIVAASGDVFYTLSFYLRALRTMSHFGWGEGCSRKLLKKTNLLPLLKPFDKTVIRMAE